MVKVVYNACYGGFGLSKLAMEKLVQLGVENAAQEMNLIDEVFKESRALHPQYYIRDLPRHDPRLVQVVEELGPLASGVHAKLKIANISDNRYRIDEYDGMENVVEPRDAEEEWVHVK